MMKKNRLAAVLLLLAMTLASIFSAGALAEADNTGADIPKNWFDDAVFLGDSLTGSLATYCMMNDDLGKAQIVFMNGLGCHTIVEENIQIGYAGKVSSVEGIVKASGAKKLFLMLAMNDVGYPTDYLKDCWTTLLGRIRKKCPKIDIYIQSGTPLLKDNLYFTKKNMDEYNDMLREICEEEGCIYVDVTPGIANEDGYLNPAFKQKYVDDNVHFNFDGCAVWTENLRTSALYFPKPEF